MKEILQTKIRNTSWFKVVIVIVLLTAPHYLESFFPMPGIASGNEYWTYPSLMPWVHIFTLVIRAGVLIFLVWAVVRLITSDE